MQAFYKVFLQIFEKFLYFLAIFFISWYNRYIIHKDF